MKPVLILGGSGQAGAETARLLRRWHPELPLTIAGRNLGRAQRVADELGAASAVTIDLARRDLGLADDHDHSAVVATLWDERLNGLYYAQQRGLPYLSLSSGLVDIAPEVIAGAQRSNAVLIASHFFAGALTLATLELAKEFERLDTIHVGAVLDEQDAGGPAALADLERWGAVTSAGSVRRDGVFTWVSGDEAQVEVLDVEGVPMPAQTIGILDVPSLALATGAPNVRFDFAVGESSGRRRGGSPSVEVRIDLAGVGLDGTPLSSTHYLVNADGQNPLTAAGIALGVERLIGLRGDPAAPGIHTPEALIDPARAVKRMTELGATLVNARAVA